MRFSVTMLVLTVVAYTNLHSPCPAGEAPPLNLKCTRILVCAGYCDLMNIPAVRKLKAAARRCAAVVSRNLPGIARSSII